MKAAYPSQLHSSYSSGLIFKYITDNGEHFTYASEL